MQMQFHSENGQFAFWGVLIETTNFVFLMLVRKPVVYFLSVIIELFSLSVTVEALRANID